MGQLRPRGQTSSDFRRTGAPIRIHRLPFYVTPLHRYRRFDARGRPGHISSGGRQPMVNCRPQTVAGAARPHLLGSSPSTAPPPPPSPQTGGPGHQIHGEVSNKTADAGLRSAARNNKATRLLTRPGRTSQSSARVSSQRAVKLQSRAASLAACPFEVLAVPIRIRVRRAGEDRSVPAWILT